MDVFSVILFLPRPTNIYHLLSLIWKFVFHSGTYRRRHTYLTGGASYSELFLWDSKKKNTGIWDFYSTVGGGDPPLTLRRWILDDQTLLFFRTDCLCRWSWKTTMLPSASIPSKGKENTKTMLMPFRSVPWEVTSLVPGFINCC